MFWSLRESYRVCWSKQPQHKHNLNYPPHAVSISSSRSFGETLSPVFVLWDQSSAAPLQPSESVSWSPAFSVTSSRSLSSHPSRQCRELLCNPCLWGRRHVVASGYCFPSVRYCCISLSWPDLSGLPWLWYRRKGRLKMCRCRDIHFPSMQLTGPFERHNGFQTDKEATDRNN